MSGVHQDVPELGSAIAIVGMAGRFPGARDVEQFWSNLRQGVHSVSFFSDEEVLAAGVDPRRLADPSYVRAGGVLEDRDRFDSAFFGFTPREADVMDPQHRVLLETAWAALEDAGYAPGDGITGIYAGSPANDYELHVHARPDVVEALGAFQVGLANGRDFLATHAAHRLNLRGPAVNVHTACSTGLVAVHVACQALAAGECDMAVAGGVAVKTGEPGYQHTPGGIASPDGFCRAFSQDSAGLVGGDGIGLVVLKRLADAVADGDTIRAVIRGSAINNDGAQKVGFTAPSVEGQAAVIEEALGVGGVDPETIGYVEAHGSGTALGDPIEVAALTQAFDTDRTQFCALGSVKTNVGHLDAAAGAAGLIKATLAVERGEIPPSLHYAGPNPQIDFASSPFFVNTRLRPWPGADGAGGADGAPRRAGVSSFGIGGTNAHVVLEQAPRPEPSVPARPWHLLTLSARTPAALEEATDRLATHLRAHPGQALHDTAYTLQVGRKPLEHRRALVARSVAEAAETLEGRTPERVFGGTAPGAARPVAFLFPGLGSHYPGMGRGLYETEPVFRETVDRCAELLRPHVGEDLRDVLYPAGASADGSGAGIDLRAMLGRASIAPGDPGAELNVTRLAQPALFITEYALAKLWMAWGVHPAAMVGHSLGEYVAATLAGVWSLEDALVLTAERARLVAELPPGGMMGVSLPPEEVGPLLRGGLSIGALNGPAITVLSGPVDALEDVQREMEERGIVWRRLPLQHAFHSSMMEPVAERLSDLLRRTPLKEPTLPFASSVTGTWITRAQATDPAYWSRHLCSTVRFSDGVETIAREGIRVLLETGPGHGLRMLASQLTVWDAEQPVVVASMRHAYERQPDSAHLLGAAGRLWAAGVPVDWRAVHAHERLRRVPLPTYPFERRRHWMERPAAGAFAAPAAVRSADAADWLHVPAWKRAPLTVSTDARPAKWLVLADGAGIGAGLAARLRAGGHTVAVASAGDRFHRAGEGAYTVRPGSGADLAALREALDAAGTRPSHVVQLWGIDPQASPEREHARGYGSVAALAAAFARETTDALRVTLVTEGAQDVAGGEPVVPARAAVLGAGAVLTREHPHVTCRTVDVRVRPGTADRLADQLLAEVTADGTGNGADAETALRGTVRWTRAYEAAPAVWADGASAVRFSADAVPADGGSADAVPAGVGSAGGGPGAAGLRRGGGYLFSGALTGAGYSMMEHLAGTLGARIALVVDPSVPERAAWDGHLASAAHRHDATTHTIGWLRAAEANGVAPLLLRALPDDAAGLRSAIERARAEFGRLDGIVHAPGLGAAAGYAPLATSPVEPAVAALDRLDGELAALRDATAGAALDFVLLQGSLVPASTGTGVGAAAAAYAMIDGWAQRVAAEGGGRWTSAGWDRWRVDGEEGGDGIHPAEGVRAFPRLAALAGEPRVLVTPRDPATRAARAAASASAARTDDAPHARPALRNDFQAPATPAEESIAAVWRDLFGIGEIGVRDDFFQLGGHSLLAMQLVSRVRDLFQVEIPLPAVFEAPTVAGLAEVVNEAMLLELEAMSDEEVMSELHFHGSGGRGGEAAVGEASPHLLLAALDELSDEALDRLLAGDSGEGTFQ